MHGIAADVHTVPGKAHAMPQVSAGFSLWAHKGPYRPAACRAGQPPAVALRVALHLPLACHAGRYAPRRSNLAVHPYPLIPSAPCGRQGEAEMRRLMAFWARHLSRRPTAADLPPGAAGGEGDLLEVRPGEVSIQLVGEQDG